MPSNEVSLTVDFKNVKLVQEIIKKFTDEATRLEERNGILYSHIELLNKALDVLCPLVARTIDFLPSEQFTLIAATREALDNVTYIQNKEYRENTNQDYYKHELYLDEDFRTLAKTYPADVSAIGVTTLIDYVEAVEAELARRDEIIARLKEDAERLASTYVIEVFPHEWVCRGGCHHWARFGEQIDHAPDCPVALHRALMKELE